MTDCSPTCGPDQQFEQGSRQRPEVAWQHGLAGTETKPDDLLPQGRCPPHPRGEQHVGTRWRSCQRSQPTEAAGTTRHAEAFLLDHDKASLALISRAFAGQTEDLTRDDVLHNITLFWLTNTAISAARLYAENKTSFFGINGVTLPVAVSVFPDELYQAPKSWAEQAYSNLVHYNRLPKGGHFAAWEQPELLVEETRAGLRSLR
ncbi:hypothetical protein ACWDBO_34365 [Streptomyces mirabilis]|uniref:hypothetical protein n=1 Tax=Streptomyces TaxID=1883 RepID=UPI0029B7C86B|nr:hypothetical protein [Streptomyces sp. AK02-04a]MDX3760196.1 hypothetical protein [Streptomyces sp. AK02-04a]